MGDRKQYHKEYYQNNKEKIDKRNKEYNESNKEKIKKQKKQYYKNNITKSNNLDIELVEQYNIQDLIPEKI